LLLSHHNGNLVFSVRLAIKLHWALNAAVETTNLTLNHKARSTLGVHSPA